MEREAKGGGGGKSKNRMHEKRSFFKYVSASTAQIILENKTLRWSSPLEFNDPFDVPRELAFGVYPKDIQTELVRRLIQLIDAPPGNTDNFSDQVKLIIQLAKKPGARELKETLSKELFGEIKESPSSSIALEAFRGRWRKLIPELRILCLAEYHDKASMWYHYANKYQGAVIEIICCDELDSAWLMAKKMNYPYDKPDVYTSSGWAEFLLMPQQGALEKITELAIYSKSPDWAYEDEWRISTWMRPGEHGTYSDYPLNAEELGNLYLGPLISDSDRSALVDLAARLPNMKVFNTYIGMSREFLFDEITS